MNIRRNYQREEPEINLIPMLDVLLVIIIFLMLTTSYSRYSGIEINLPTADTPNSNNETKDINVAINAIGTIQINGTILANNQPATISSALIQEKNNLKENPAPMVIINADAKTAHQQVIDVLQSAQLVGLPHVSFATQQENQKTNKAN